jgi:hypothetical protein
MDVCDALADAIWRITNQTKSAEIRFEFQDIPDRRDVTSVAGGQLIVLMKENDIYCFFYPAPDDDDDRGGLQPCPPSGSATVTYLSARDRVTFSRPDALIEYEVLSSVSARGVVARASLSETADQRRADVFQFPIYAQLARSIAMPAKVDVRDGGWPSVVCYSAQCGVVETSEAWCRNVDGDWSFDTTVSAPFAELQGQDCQLLGPSAHLDALVSTCAAFAPASETVLTSAFYHLGLNGADLRRRLAINGARPMIVILTSAGVSMVHVAYSVNDMWHCDSHHVVGLHSKDWLLSVLGSLVHCR